MTLLLVLLGLDHNSIGVLLIQRMQTNRRHSLCSQGAYCLKASFLFAHRIEYCGYNMLSSMKMSLANVIALSE